MEDFFKKAIFDHAQSDAVLVVNGDDSYGQRLYTSYQQVHTITAGTQRATDFCMARKGL